MSSRPSLDRVDERFVIVLSGVASEMGRGEEWAGVCTYDFGAMWRNPAELTALSRFRSETKAELCGSSISRPYRHLKR